MKLVLKFSKDQVQRSKTISIKRSVTEALRSAEQPAEEVSLKHSIFQTLTIVCVLNVNVRNFMQRMRVNRQERGKKRRKERVSLNTHRVYLYRHPQRKRRTRRRRRLNHLQKRTPFKNSAMLFLHLRSKLFIRSSCKFSAKIFTICNIVNCSDDANQIFWSPVTEEVAPGYFSVITKPMDLSTMESKAESGAYKSWSDVQVCVQ